MLLEVTETIPNLENTELHITVTDLGVFLSYFNRDNLFNSYSIETNTRWCNNNNEWRKLTIKLPNFNFIKEVGRLSGLS